MDRHYYVVYVSHVSFFLKKLLTKVDKIQNRGKYPCTAQVTLAHEDD